MENTVKTFWGRGNGFGYGYGSGNDFGRGDGDGFGFGNGFGSGDGFMKSFNGMSVNYIDGIATVLTKIKGNIAKGFIVNGDFTTTKCYVVKDGRIFAHGDTLKNAIQALNEKKWADLDTDQVIEEFLKQFKKEKKYKGKVFFIWHNRLTGSCEMGRNLFVKQHNIDLNDMFTVEEFIELTQNAYGGEIIKKLKKEWSKKYDTV